MLMRVIFIVCLFFTSSAFAGGRGGHRTTWDANLFGGGWSNIITSYGASCNGTGTGDDTAFTNFAAAAVAANPAIAKLYIPPGSDCRVNNTDYFRGVRNLIVWAYGATIDFVQLGSLTVLYQDATHNAFIQSVSAGASVVTLVTGAEITRFSVGDWVLVNALAMQSGGFPGNWNFNEWRLITAINGAIITLNSPLQYAYSSAYPAWSGVAYDAGPANISLVNQLWNVNIAWYGGTITVGPCLGIQGRTISLYDVYYVHGPCPSMIDNFSVSFSMFAARDSVEIDKNVNAMSLYRVSAKQLLFQSSSINQVNTISSTMSITPADSFGLNGMPTNLTAINSVIPWIQLNPIGYGHTVNILFDGTLVTTVSRAVRAIPDSWFSFSGGVLTIPNADPNQFHVFEFSVPGQKYYNSSSDGTPCAIVVPFTITGLTQDVTNTMITTNLVSKPTCGQTLYYAPYPAATIKQTNSPAGSVDMTQYSAP